MIFIWISQLCVIVALAKAKPQDNAYFKGSNTVGQDLVGVQNSGSGSKPIQDAEESDLNPGFRRPIMCLAVLNVPIPLGR